MDCATGVLEGTENEKNIVFRKGNSAKLMSIERGEHPRKTNEGNTTIQRKGRSISLIPTVMKAPLGDDTFITFVFACMHEERLLSASIKESREVRRLLDSF